MKHGIWLAVCVWLAVAGAWVVRAESAAGSRLLTNGDTTEASAPLGAGAGQVGTVTILVSVAESTWQLTGPVSVSGTNAWAGSVPTGTYTVSYGMVPGYFTPPREVRVLSFGSTLTFTGLYTEFGPGEKGSVSISVNRSYGFWQLYGPSSSSWVGTNNWASSMPVGTYSLVCGPLAGYMTPYTQLGVVYADGVELSFAGNYKYYQAYYGDYDGDRRTDLAVYYQSAGIWQLRLSSQGYASVGTTFGGPDYVPVQADYDGDRKLDLAVYSKTTGKFYARLSSAGYTLTSADFVPTIVYTFVPADYDGDGKADPAVYNEYTGQWAVKLSNSGYTTVTASFGGAGRTPVVGDFDGDRLADFAIYQDATGTWSFRLSITGYELITATLGGAGSVPLVGDYDGDGTSDPAIYNETTGVWSIMLSRSGYAVVWAQFGGSEYRPVPGDYDGDGKTDLAVYKESTGLWGLRLSGSGDVVTGLLGGPELMPVQ